MARFQTGTTFMGRYVLLGPAGHGGVSVVYRALDTLNGRHVAIKMLDPTLAADTRAQERMRREAIITQRMRHPSVPRVYEYGQAPHYDGTSIAYVVMELLDGTVLARYLTEGPLPWLDAVHIAATVADVLAVAHKRGVVHRDLTAANIMITEVGARIIDFGVAVTIKTPEPGPYILDPVPLSNDFAGPGEPADDVYALGRLLIEMLTGQSPANLPPPTATAAMRLTTPAPVLTTPGVPRSLADICRRSLAPRPADRPDAATVALDLWALIVPMSVPLTRPAIVAASPLIQPALAPRQEPPPPPHVREVHVLESGRPVARDTPTGETPRPCRNPPWTARSNTHRTVERIRRSN